MSIQLIANIFSFAGALIMVGTGFLRGNGKVLKAQCLQFTLMGVANFMLGGITGFISNIIGILRNVYSLKFTMSNPVKIGFIVIQTVISLIAGINGWVGWLPIAATILFTVCVDTDSEIIMKSAIIFGQLCWLIYDLHYGNYAGATFDILTVATSLYGIIAAKRTVTQEALS